MPHKRFKLHRPPLKLVLAQIAVNPVESLGGKYISDIQDALRKSGFTEFEPGLVPTVHMEPGKIQFREDNIWCFRTRDKQKAVILSPDTVVLQKSVYDTFHTFQHEIRDVIETVHKIVSYSFYRRLGLRYVNQINAIDESQTWELLNSELKGFDSPDLTRVRNQSESLFQMDNGLLAMRFAEMPGASASMPFGINPFGLEISLNKRDTIAILDIDRFHQDQFDFDLESICNTFLEFNGDIESAFRSAITENALTLWEEEKGNIDGDANH